MLIIDGRLEISLYFAINRSRIIMCYYYIQEDNSGKMLM